jgi:hypothetical protein
VFGIPSDGGDYWDISASLPVGETGLTLGAYWGTFGFDDVSAADYDDWSIGASYDMGKLGKLGDGFTVAHEVHRHHVTAESTPFSGPNWTPPIGNGD